MQYVAHTNVVTYNQANPKVLTATTQQAPTGVTRTSQVTTKATLTTTRRVEATNPVAGAANMAMAIIAT